MRARNGHSSSARCGQSSPNACWVWAYVLALLKELHAANPLLLLTGGPISMTWEAANLPAIMTIWYGGQMMGQAVANALTGAVSPAGRSPFTWPTGLEQVPDELDMSPSTPPGKAHQTWCRLRSVEKVASGQC